MQTPKQWLKCYYRHLSLTYFIDRLQRNMTTLTIPLLFLALQILATAMSLPSCPFHVHRQIRDANDGRSILSWWDFRQRLHSGPPSPKGFYEAAGTPCRLLLASEMETALNCRPPPTLVFPGLCQGDSKTSSEEALGYPMGLVAKGRIFK